MEFIEFQNYKLAYEKEGEGPAFLLFPGFGQKHTAFDPMVQVFKSRYTCYSFDLFHHGESKAPAGAMLDLETWDSIFRLFLEKEKLDTFSVGGFSLGSKYVLAILMKHAPEISRLILLAPDGIKSNIWYKLATYPAPVRKFFRSMIRYPQRFYFIVRPLRTLGVIDKNVGRFIEKQMHSPSQRTRIYNSWVGMRSLKFKTRDIIHQLNQYNIATEVFLAKRDYIIPGKPFISFCKKISSCQLRVLDCGHYSLIKAVAGYYAES